MLGRKHIRCEFKVTKIGYLKELVIQIAFEEMSKIID